MNDNEQQEMKPVAIVNTTTNISKLYYYIKYTNLNSILDNNTMKELLYSSLNKIKSVCYKSVILREKSQELRDDITDLERMYVRADNLDISEQGRNTGGKENDVELRHIKILKLKEELARLTNESLCIDKSLQDNKDLFRDIFDELLTEAQATVMKLFYIDCWTTLKIATELFYTRDYVRIVKNRATKRIINALIEFQDKNIK